MVDGVKQHSVTRDDVGTVGGAQVWHWMLNPVYGAPGGLPAYWSSARDYYLRDLLYQPFHDFWAGAIGIAITKMGSQAWDVTGDTPTLRKHSHELLMAFMDEGLSRHLQDFICTDNGAFVEVVRATKAAGSRILGLMHLDSLRITRTGDPDIPAIYRDTKGANHEMKAHQILMLSDMPSSAEMWYGVGLCAASRAWGAIKKLEAIERYYYEKIAGEKPLAVDLVGGISEPQLRTAIESAKEDNHKRGNIQYMGAVVVPTLSDIAITHERINFAELPDNFVYEDQFNNCVLLIANAIGLDIQDLQPLTGRPLGTAMQSEVLEEKSRGKGLASWRQQFTHAINENVLADTVTFAFSEKDNREKQQKAEITDTWAGAVGTMVEKIGLTPAQGLQMLADEEIVPKEFIPNDTTPNESLSDTEKPEAEATAQNAAQPEAQTAPQPVPAAKESDPLRQQFYAALARFDAAMKEGKQR